MLHLLKFMNVENETDVLKLIAEIIVNIMKVEANTANIKAILTEIYNVHQSQSSQNLPQKVSKFASHKQTFEAEKKINRVEIILGILKKLFSE